MLLNHSNEFPTRITAERGFTKMGVAADKMLRLDEVIGKVAASTT